MTLTWPDALDNIAHRAQSVDIAGRWPGKNLADLQRCGALMWSIPRQYGGAGMAAVRLHQRYGQLAAACLTTALILTQRDAALEFLICAANSAVCGQQCRKLLAALAENKIFASIGIAQLTTSGQHHTAGVVAAPHDRGWIVSGIIPWSTGAAHSSFLIAGARTTSGDQLLFILKMKQPGVRVVPPAAMAVLNASNTAAVELRNVLISPADILAGPCANALAMRNKYRRFTLNTCVLPLGVAAGALAAAREAAATRSARCRAMITELRQRHRELSRQVYARGADKVEADSAAKPAILRAQCNDLCYRCAAAALELAKGRGLMCDHPAQRRLREAMFFFVWSSGAGVIEETLARLAAPP